MKEARKNAFVSVVSATVVAVAMLSGSAQAMTGSEMRSKEANIYPYAEGDKLFAQAFQYLVNSKDRYSFNAQQMMKQVIQATNKKLATRNKNLEKAYEKQARRKKKKLPFGKRLIRNASLGAVNFSRETVPCHEEYPAHCTKEKLSRPKRLIRVVSLGTIGFSRKTKKCKRHSACAKKKRVATNKQFANDKVVGLFLHVFAHLTNQSNGIADRLEEAGNIMIQFALQPKLAQKWATRVYGKTDKHLLEAIKRFARKKPRKGETKVDAVKRAMEHFFSVRYPLFVAALEPYEKTEKEIYTKKPLSKNDFADNVSDVSDLSEEYSSEDEIDIEDGSRTPAPTNSDHTADYRNRNLGFILEDPKFL